MIDPFIAAVEEMQRRSLQVTEPRNFLQYLDDRGIPRSKVKTWDCLSIDHVSRLRPALRDNSIMVFRLGSPKGCTGTNFGLARTVEGFGDYFLDDSEIFGNLPYEAFTPNLDHHELVGYRLFPALTETSLVNLGIASGLVGAALDLSADAVPRAPATGRSTFTFKVRPHQQFDASWTHTNGQVEIDALFVGRRNERSTVFVMEAKAGPSGDTLAKHKLVYPVLATAPGVPQEMDIVPVYLRAHQTEDAIIYYIAECSFPDPRARLAGVNELQVHRVRCLSMTI